jgi:hypothetical protein
MDSGPAPGSPQASELVDRLDAEGSLRRRLQNPFLFRAYLWRQLPLAALAGLRLDRIDEGSCTISLPGGFRTRNPFGSMYFAAQAMAAEMSTGVPALILARASPGRMALVVREVKGVFVKKIATRARFTFSRIEEMRTVVASTGGEGSFYVAHSEGVDAEGTVASAFEITWSFKKRA